MSFHIDQTVCKKIVYLFLFEFHCCFLCSPSWPLWPSSTVTTCCCTGSCSSWLWWVSWAQWRSSWPRCWPSPPGESPTTTASDVSLVRMRRAQLEVLCSPQLDESPGGDGDDDDVEGIPDSRAVSGCMDQTWNATFICTKSKDLRGAHKIYLSLGRPGLALIILSSRILNESENILSTETWWIEILQSN